MGKRKKELSKKDLRRQRRKQAQLRAFGIAGGALVVLVLIIGIIVFGITKIVSKNKAPEVVEETPVVEEEVVVETEPVEEPEPEIVEEQVRMVPTVSEDEIPTELSEAQKQTILDEYIGNQLTGMTLEQKVAGLFFVTTEQIFNSSDLKDIASSESEILQKYPVGGILFTEDNMESEEQLMNFANGLRSVNGNELFIAVEEPYGENSPFVQTGITEAVLPSESEIGENGDSQNAYKLGFDVGSELSRCGINTMFGPVADLSFSSSGYTASRSFGSEPETVGGMVRQMVKGLSDQNIRSGLRFFPGYGDVTNDPRNNRSFSNRTVEDIIEKEKPVYDPSIRRNVEFIQVSQVAYKQITVDVPACLSSSIVTDILRNEFNYDGIIVTDYMNNRAMYEHYKHADAAVMAIEAGCDMIFCPGNFQKAYNGILDAINSGKIPESRIDESLYRIYRVKYKDKISYDVGNSLLGY